MRVISGFLKSRIINIPSGIKNIRPTTDRARETIFNIISNRFEISGKIIFDLFCGSGSLGIECISRGAEKVYFVDKNTEIVKNNLYRLGIMNNSIIIRSGALEFLKDNKSKVAYLIFADPPYNFRNYENLIINAAVYKSLLILEHSKNFDPENKFGRFIILKKTAGISKFTFFNFSEYTNEKEN